MSSSTTALPPNSLILVTGATSYVASYIIRALLTHNHPVLGLVRDLPAATWLTTELFPSHARRGLFSLAHVPDLAAPGALDAVIQEHAPAAIIHVATPYSFSPDPREVIPPAVAIVSNLLEAAARCPSVRRVVLTSTSGTACAPQGDVDVAVDRDTWNEAVVEAAWAPPPYDPARGPKVYAASKLAAEKAVFQFVAERAPGFVVNAVNPFLVIGPVLHERHRAGTAGWVRKVYEGEPGMFAFVPPICQVNVQDVAALHVAAVLDPEVRGERLFAWGEAMNMNKVLAVLRRQYPDRTFIEDTPPQSLCRATIADEGHILSLLKKWGGRDGWISLEQGVREGMASPEPEV